MNDGGPAFPSGHGSEGAWGMSIRDWFAGQALAGMMADHEETGSAEKISVAAYSLADAMLRARERGQEGSDDAWALRDAVTIRPTVGAGSIHPTSWTARCWDGVRTLEESAPTIAAAIRALRAKVEGGAR